MTRDRGDDVRFGGDDGRRRGGEHSARAQHRDDRDDRGRFAGEPGGFRDDRARSYDARGGYDRDRFGGGDNRGRADQDRNDTARRDGYRGYPGYDDGREGDGYGARYAEDRSRGGYDDTYGRAARGDRGEDRRFSDADRYGNSPGARDAGRFGGYDGRSRGGYESSHRQDRDEYGRFQGERTETYGGHGGYSGYGGYGARGDQDGRGDDARGGSDFSGNYDRRGDERSYRMRDDEARFESPRSRWRND